ncbi:UNVERIFIED_CONTAM: hypothetical protein GTU68_034155, partial [Idotea baltica]|nr:hypothetical protein [Idotea baltica]
MNKTFDAAEAEDRLYRAWDEAGCFKAGANATRAETYCVMIPPPNVTGSLHMGHAFNNTLQDILVRWHRMRGFDTLWQPGQDHAGIATQMVVERELAKDGKRRTDFSREDFTAKVWEQKQKSGGTIIGQLKRLGASLDWSRNAFTMSGAPGAPAGEVFVDMYNKGLIYRGKRLVNWDPHFETAISDLEVENVEVAGHMWHFKYPLAEERDYISIATTRPETMLGDGAVAVHPSDERYASIVGKLCEIPVGPKEHRRLIPIITDDYPDPDFGSGAVKITGAHDFNDYQVAKRGNIPMYGLMDTKGAMRNDVPDEYRGLDRFEARTRVVADITAEGLAPFVENKPIMQPFGDRSKVVIEPMLTDQWFVDTDKIVGPALDAVRNGDVKIVPEREEKVYFHWLENIEPWCISRQLWWGHQIPVWYGLDLSYEHAIGEDGELDYVELHKLLMLWRDPDVLDTWFSSGLWPIGTLGWPEDTPELARYFPTSDLITGTDILFFWVARMMMMQLSVVGQIPFDTVYLHGLVRDAKGKKMSKSVGNVVDPLEVIDEYGADAL